MISKSIFICIIFLCSLSHALFTVEPQSDGFMALHGRYQPGKNGIDRIQAGRLVYLIKNENIVRYNKTDLKGLLERKIFKIKSGDIYSMELGSL